jgi:acylphosphatase
MTRRTVYFSGRVQGVGFRYTACSIARGYDLRGFVRNLPDGRVEAIIEGDTETVDRFLEHLKREFSGHVHDVKESDAPPTGEFVDFGVRF